MIHLYAKLSRRFKSASKFRCPFRRKCFRGTGCEGAKPTLCPDVRFPEVADFAGATISEYYGVLSRDPSYRCRIRAEHLRGSDRSVEPFKSTLESTHQFWCWIEKRHSNTPKVLVYRIQVDLAHPQSRPKVRTFLRRRQEQKAYDQWDGCAAFTNIILASVINQHSKGVGLLDGSDEFWCMTIDSAYKSFWEGQTKIY